MSHTAPYSAALSARATPSTQKQKQAPYRPPPIVVATPATPYTPAVPSANSVNSASTTLVTFRDNKQLVSQPAGSLSHRQQKEWNLMQRVITTSPTRASSGSTTLIPSQSPPGARPAPPSVVRTMSTREHATGNLRDQTRVIETDEAFLTVPTRANPQQSPLLTSTTATFSIVDTIPPGATLARQEMEGKIDAQKRLERERREELERGIENEKAQIDAELDSLRSQLALAQQAQEEGNNADLAASLEESLKAKEEEASTRKFALDIKLKQLAAAIAKNALPPTEPHHTRAASETTIAMAADVLHMAPNPPATLLLRSKEGLDLLDFQSIQQKLLSLVVGNPVHDLFSSILTDFFKRIFVHFTTIDMVKKESLDLTKQRELLYDATREIERELRLLKTKASSMELTIATQEGMISRRTTELTNARENYYKNLLLIREIVQQHGIHPDLLVDYMPSDIANSDAKLAITEKQRQAEFAAMTSKIMAAMEQRLGLLLTTLRNTIFGIMQNFQKKIDRCNAKIRSIDVYLSKSRYKMRKQIYVYDALIRGELTPEKIKEIQDKHARDEDIAEAEREARRAAAAAEAAVAQLNEAHEKNLHSPRSYTNTNWEELQETHPQGYQALMTLTARHKAQWERMERQARDGDLELMDEDDLNEQLDTVMRDHGQTPRISISGNNTARSNRAESEGLDGESVADVDSSVPGSARGKGKKDSRPSSGRKGNSNQQSSGRKGDKTSTEVRDSDSTGSSRASSRRETQQLSPSSSIAQLLGEAAPARNSTPKGAASAARKASVLHKNRPSSIGKKPGSGKKKKHKSSTDDGDGADEEEDDFEEAGSHGVGGNGDDYSTARQQQIEKEWNNVETEHDTREKDKEQRAKARAAGSASRLGREKSRLMRSAGGTASSSAATSRADSPARGAPPSGGRGTSLLRPSAAAAIASAQGAGMDSRSTSRRGSGGAWNTDDGPTEQNTGDESSEHSNISSPRTQRSARLAAARREVDSQLHAVDDEVSKATSAAAALEKRNREILERIRALDEERRMLASNSPASGSGQATSSLASPISTRRSSFSHGSVSTVGDGGSDSGAAAADSARKPVGTHPAPPELDDRLTEEARAKAKEERLARIQYASHLERQKKELEKERKMTEKENARLAAKLKQLESQKREMHAAMDKIESESSTSKITDRPLHHSSRTRLRFDDESKTDKDVSEVNEHENIFHKIVMRSVGLQVGMPFTYEQQQQQFHSPVRSETLSGMNDANIGPLLSLLQKHLALQQQQQQQQQAQETKEDSTNATGTVTAGTSTSAVPGTYRVVAPGDYPHPLLLEMSALGIDPRHLQLFLQQQLSSERFPIPMFSMEGPVRHHARAPTSGPSSREGSPSRRQPPQQTWDLYPTIPVAGFENNAASIRSYLEGGEDPAQSIQSFPIGFPPRNPPGSANSARRRATANAGSQSSPSPPLSANPNSLAGISSSLTLSPSQRDVLFKAELKRRKELEKSLNVFARVQARGATSEENAKYVRTVMQMERQKEMERVLKDLDLLKSNMSASSIHQQASGGISSASVRTGSTSPSRASSNSLTGQNANNNNNNNNSVSHHSLRSHSSASNRSRPSTAGGNMPLSGQTIEELQSSGGWDNYTPRGAANSGVTTVLRSNPKQVSYPHVNSGAIQSASNFSLKQARPSSAQINTANALVHAATNDRRSALLTSVMGEPRMQLQQQSNRKGQSYSP